MYVSFTDWEFDGDVYKAVEGIKANWAEMKKYGAVNAVALLLEKILLEP